MGFGYLNTQPTINALARLSTEVPGPDESQVGQVHKGGDIDIVFSIIAPVNPPLPPAWETMSMRCPSIVARRDRRPDSSDNRFSVDLSTSKSTRSDAI